MSRNLELGEFPIGAMYAPFCRTKAPPEEEWEQDLERMKQLGFTCLHAFSEWHDVEPRKGVFDFSALDRVVGLAIKVGLVPFVNVATLDGVGYYPPRWLMAEYKGPGVLTSDGRENIPRGLYGRPCLDDPWYLEYADRYLVAVAEHYRDVREIGGWIIWGEPGRIGRDGRLICYCPHTVRRFRDWLKAKYGSVAALNGPWGTEGPSGFDAWEEIEPPTGAVRHMGGYAAFADWRTFMEENLAWHIAHVDCIFKAHGVRQPSIVEIMNWTGNNSTTSIDTWKLAEAADVVGVSNFLPPGKQSAYVLSKADSVATFLDKEFLVVEGLGGPRYVTRPLHTPSAAELVLEAAQALGAGSKGFMYWCYRPRMSDVEGGEFGLVRADGQPLPRAVEAGRFAAEMAGKLGVFRGACRQPQVLIYDSQEIEHISHADNLLTDVASYDACRRGAFEMIADCQIDAGFISSKHIIGGKLAGCHALVLPFSYVMDEEVARCIARFVKEGGTVVADYPLGLKRSDGSCYRELPGAGLAELFGFVKADVRLVEEEGQLAVDGVVLPAGTFVDLTELGEGAEVEAFLSDGVPAVVSHRHGRGRTVYFAYQFFAMYAARPEARERARLLGLLEQGGVERLVDIPEYAQTDRVPVGCSLLHLPGGSRVLTVMNYSKAEVGFSLTVRGGCPRAIKDLRSGIAVPFAAARAAARLDVRLEAQGFFSALLEAT